MIWDWHAYAFVGIFLVVVIANVVTACASISEQEERRKSRIQRYEMSDAICYLYAPDLISFGYPAAISCLPRSSP